jgi:hypothetical protein
LSRLWLKQWLIFVHFVSLVWPDASDWEFSRGEQQVVQPNKEKEEGLFYRFKVSKITYLIDGGQGKKSLPTCCQMRKSRDYNT